MKDKKSINIFPIATFAAGFYAGVKETSGVDLGPGVELITKYLPTIFAVAQTSGIQNLFGKVSKVARKGIENQDIDIPYTDPQSGGKTDRKYSEASFKEQVQTSTVVNKFERQTHEMLEDKPLEKILYSGMFTGTTTLLGYWAGSAFAMSQLMAS